MTDGAARKSPAMDIAAGIRGGELSAVGVLEEHLDRIAEREGDVHAFNFVMEDQARARAAEIDRLVAAGGDPGPLAGVPVALKDLLCTRGVPTTCSSRILEGWLPPYDATVTRRLREADVVVLGKSNMDEFAMGSSTENSAYGPTRNPWDLERIPGGSGGGSAAALASFEAPLAIGTDTGGSIRQPGAVTGTVGAKPTYGGISRYGLVAMANSLDQAGPVTRTVLDAALLHEIVGGRGRVRGTAVDRHRHRRLDPPARRRHRHRRAQADLRRGVALRPDRVLVLARPGRTVRADRA